jgi:hypothetical protein
LKQHCGSDIISEVIKALISTMESAPLNIPAGKAKNNIANFWTSAISAIGVNISTQGKLLSYKANVP